MLNWCRIAAMQKRSSKPLCLFPEMNLTKDNPWLSSPLVFRKKPATKRTALETLELCAGGGGQALGFEKAGIGHIGLVEIDAHACSTLQRNRPAWQVFRQDLNQFEGMPFKGVDIISGGLPCPPFSVAGKQLGHRDDRIR